MALLLLVVCNERVEELAVVIVTSEEEGLSVSFSPGFRDAGDKEVDGVGVTISALLLLQEEEEGMPGCIGGGGRCCRPSMTLYPL
mmetsp:Transcript_34532/g.52180  ORF Transcript_34532/g.52180 Transcript_34532/m.52180 type:complete len:85 (-) Transcript_34532:47-301(-)